MNQKIEKKGTIMKKLFLSLALIGGFEAQIAASAPAVAPAPVITGINIGAYTKPWDMVRDLMTKHPRREAIKPLTFSKKSLIIPGIVALVAMAGAKVVEYVWNGYNFWGYRGLEGKDTRVDWQGFEEDGLRGKMRYNDVSRRSETTYYNRDQEVVGFNLSEDAREAYSSFFGGNQEGTITPATTWQKLRWAVGSRVKNPWNWGAPAVGLVAGLHALIPTFWKLGREYRKNFAAEQEKQVDRIVDVWKDAKHFFPEELHNAFDTLVELKKKNPTMYESSRARVLTLMLKGCSSICPVI
jgi:hypothetical protein